MVARDTFLRLANQNAANAAPAIAKKIAEFKKKTLEIVTRAAADGKLEQYTLSVE
jgi:hypothetical protein